MKKYLEQLRPLERRLVVGVGVMLLIVLNWAFIWPHFSDAANYHNRLDDANRKLKTYTTLVAQKPELEKQVRAFQSQGDYVAPSDQSIDLMRTLQTQAAACGFAIQNFGHTTMQTNEFFVEQIQNITLLAEEKNVVDFLYKLGSGSSMIRVRDLSLQPDAPRQRLAADIKLVASYQKNSTAPAAKTTAKAK